MRYRDGGIEEAPPGSGSRRCHRDHLDHFCAQMGSSLQGRVSLGWRTGGIQLASGFSGDRIHFLARNGYVGTKH